MQLIRNREPGLARKAEASWKRLCKGAGLAAIALLMGASVATADDADVFFDDSYVHEIRLTIDDENWYTTLYNAHNSDPDDPYFEASFVGDGVSIPQIGVRFKGNSSFRINSIKKSIKLDFDEFDEENDDLTFFGLKKLNLNNSYKDPTMLREKLLLDFASQFVPTIRTVFTNVYINDELIGLYVAVEQVDKAFIEDRLGSDEDGNLYKGAASDEINNGPQSDFGSDLAWEGSEESAYYDHYQLKTNEEENDYSGLVAMVDVLNNGNPDDFPETLEPLMDVDNVMAGMAINSLFLNLDSYSGSAHNYYVYQSDQTNQFSHIFWDANEAFGSFTLFASAGNLLETEPFWSPSGESRPLMEQIWENESYARRYLGLMAKMLREGFDAETMTSRIETLANIIRADVYADPNKQYSNANFESNLVSSVGGLYGLQSFVEQRVAYLETTLDAYALQSELKINEVNVLNQSDFVDEAGEADPWIEIYNAGVGEVSLAGLYLSDSLDSPTQWALPSIAVDDGERVTLWVDGESSEGSSHANFALAEAGGTLYLFDGTGTLVDTLSYPALAEGFSFQRYPDGDDLLIYSDTSSPGSPNEISGSPSVLIYINEAMAQNETVLQDPSGSGYPDWLELYNPNEFAVDLGGMYLTDNPDIPKHWEIPDDLSIEPYGYLLIWADDDEEQGSNHANFKLSTNGEDIALYDTDINGNVLIDSISFGAQTVDISYGRETDGSSVFVLFENPTPEANNIGVQILSETNDYLVGEGYELALTVEVEGGGALTYQWSLDGDDIAGANAQTLIVTSITGADAGTYSVAVSSGNATVEGVIANVAVDTLPPAGDADLDGISNLLESAFGMDPLVADAALFPQFVYSEEGASVAFSAHRSDIDYIVESSSDLENWQTEQTVHVDLESRTFAGLFDGYDVRFYRLRLEEKE